jgi:hypothetical protein
MIFFPLVKLDYIETMKSLRNNLKPVSTFRVEDQSHAHATENSTNGYFAIDLLRSFPLMLGVRRQKHSH